MDQKDATRKILHYSFFAHRIFITISLVTGGTFFTLGYLYNNRYLLMIAALLLLFIIYWYWNNGPGKQKVATWEPKKQVAAQPATNFFKR